MFFTSRITSVLIILVGSLFAQTTFFEETFEGTTNMVVTGNGWQFGTLSTYPSPVPEGYKCAGTVLNGVYSNNANHTLTSPTINLPDSSEIVLAFYEWYQTYNYNDSIHLEIRRENSGTWEIIRATSGANGQWSFNKIDISSFRNSNIKIRFRLTSDSQNASRGWYIDSIGIYTPAYKTLIINTDGNGTVTPSGSISLETQTSYSISALPDSGYRFDNWSIISGSPVINDSDKKNTMISISADAAIQANFNRGEVYDLSSSPTTFNFGTHFYEIDTINGVRLRFKASAPGTYSIVVDSSTVKHFYYYGTDSSFSTKIWDSIYTYISYNFVAANADEHHYFNISPYTPTYNRCNFKASVHSTCTLTITDNNNGTVSPISPIIVPLKIPQKINAYPDSGYRFDKWTVVRGNAVIDDTLSQTTTVVLNENAEIKVEYICGSVYEITETPAIYNFTTHYYQQDPIQGVRFRFTAPSAGLYFIVVDSSYKTLYAYGNDSTFKQTVAARSSNSQLVYSFSAVTPDEKFYFIIRPASTIYCEDNFQILFSNPASLTITNDGNGSTSPTGTTDVARKQKVSIRANPSTGFRFSNWSVETGNAVFENSLIQNTTVQIDSDATIKANFKTGSVYDISDTVKVFNFSKHYYEIRPSYGVRLRFRAPEAGTYTLVIDSSHKQLSYYGTDSTFMDIIETIPDSGSEIAYTFSASSTGEYHHFIVRPYATAYDTTNFYAGIGSPAILIVKSDSNGIVFPSDTIEVYKGFPKTLTAIPRGGYQFLTWDLIEGNASLLSTTSASTSVSVLDDTAIVKASFQLDPNTIPYVEISDINISSHPDICITASVKDSSGRSISGLDSSDFVLTQDNDTVDFQLTTVSNVAGVSVALVIDRSGSMGGQAIIDAKNAAKQFVKSMSPLDRCAIVSFESTSRIDQVTTSDTTLLNAAIENINASGGTYILKGTVMGIEQLVQETNTRAVIVFSDGISGTETIFQDVVDSARNNNIFIYSIGIGANADRTILGALADSTGGYYSEAPNAAGLARIYSQIKSDVESQYILCYRSPDIIFNGDNHEVILSANLNNLTDRDTIYWDENNTPPVITLTPQTQAMIGVNQSANQPITISVNVIDDGTIKNVRLFYRKSNIITGSYTELPMVFSSGTQYEAVINSGNVIFPGIDFYILANDNYNLIGRSPNVLAPEKQPYVIPIENQVPVISHTAFDCVNAGRDTAVSAVITDNDGTFTAVLYYKKGNETFFTADTMKKTGTDLYSSIIPGNRITVTGIDYYIRAVDSVGAAARFPQNGYISLPMCENGPELFVPPDTSMHEGETLSFIIDAFTPDGTIPDIEIFNPPSMCTFKDSGNGNALLTFAPGCVDNGLYTIELAAINGSDTTRSGFQMRVYDINFPPEIESAGYQTSHKGEPFSLTVNVFDCDLTTPSIDLLRPPSGASFVDNNDGTGTFTWTPDSTDFGYYVLIFEAADEISIVRDTIVLEIIDANIYEPVLTLSDTIINTSINIPVTILATASDKDGNSPALNALKLPENATFTSDKDGTALFSWIPTDTGKFFFDITANDSFDSTTKVTVKVTVVISDQNITGPVFVPRPDTIILQNSEMRLQVEAQDKDGTIPEFFLVNGHRDIEFEDNGDGTATVIWIPQCDISGIYTIKIGARDESLSDTVSFKITVQDVNCAPVITHIPNISADPGEMITIPVSTYDPDNDGTVPILSVSCNLPDYTFISSDNGSAKLRCLAPNDSGIYPVTFYATDGVSTDSTKVKIAVNKYGSVVIKTDVKGAKIYSMPSGSFNGIFIGTDSIKKTYPQGTCFFEIQAPRYRPYRLRCEIEADKTVNYSVKLEKSIPLMFTGPDTLCISPDTIIPEPLFFSFADINKDGTEDLAMLSKERSSLWYCGIDSVHNRKYIKQISDQFNDIAGYNPVHHMFIDWNSDGTYDHLFSDQSGKIIVKKQNCEIPLTLLDRNSTEKLYPVIIDSENSGKRDLLVHSEGHGIFIYKNKGSDSVPAFEFTRECTDTSGQSFTAFIGAPVLLDMDSDGTREFITVSDGVIRVYSPDSNFSTLSFKEDLNCGGKRFISDSILISLIGSFSGMPKLVVNQKNSFLIYPTHLPGDVNFDGIVNIKDISIISKQMEYSEEDSGYNPVLNLRLSKSGKEIIDIRDISKASKCWELKE